MKYFLTMLATLGLAGYAFIKGYSLGNSQDDGIVSPCAPQSMSRQKIRMPVTAIAMTRIGTARPCSATDLPKPRNVPMFTKYCSRAKA
jgi:hypothetical protein